jgi:acetoin utilization deacetylase AcuC-like enzyme
MAGGMIKFTKTGFPDTRCFVVYDKIYLRHRTGNHPEHPQRLIYIKKALDESDVAYCLDWVSPRRIDESELYRIHTKEYAEKVRQACEKAGDGYIRLDLDTVVCRDSYEAALYAVGGVEQAIDHALGTGWASAFALVRPPGHHAWRDHSSGFCLFDNVAIGAKYAIDKHKIKKIMIIDWDLHHGNGVQQAFWDDPQVFYVSLHLEHYFPGTGFADEIGEGKGEGRNLNLPLPAGTGDSEYSYCFTELIGPLVMAFKPELILICAGYDAHADDPLGLMRLSVGEFGRVTYYLRRIATELDAHLVFTLEGGYDLEALPASVVETFRSLVLDKPDDVLLPHPHTVPDDVLKLVAEQKERMGRFWDISS